MTIYLYYYKKKNEIINEQILSKKNDVSKMKL